MAQRQNFSAAAHAALLAQPNLSRRDRLLLAQAQATLGTLAGTPSPAAIAEAQSVLTLLQEEAVESQPSATVTDQILSLSSRLAELG